MAAHAALGFGFLQHWLQGLRCWRGQLGLDYVFAIGIELFDVCQAGYVLVFVGALGAFEARGHE